MSAGGNVSCGRTRLPVIALAFVNIATLALLWHQYFTMQPSGHPRRSPNNNAAFLEKELALSPEQTVEFEVLRQAHFRDVHERRESSRTLRHGIVTATFEGADTPALNSMAAEIGRLEAEVETLRYRHFQDLLSVCNDAQKKKFRDVMAELNRMVAPPDMSKNLPAVPVGPGGHSR